MELLKENKVILIIVIIIVVLLAWYSMGGSGNSGGDSLMSASAPSSKSVDDRDLLKLLTSMRNIHLDGHIFENPAYKSLRDFSRSIVPEPVGRKDPFAPLPKTEITVTGGGKNLSDQVLLRD